MDDRSLHPARGVRAAIRPLVRRLTFVGLPAALVAVVAYGGSALTAGAAAGRPYLTTNSPLVFDFVEVGQTSAPLTATITNSGGGTIGLTAVQVGGDYPKDFSVVANQCAGIELSSGRSCTLTVVFHPTKPGTRLANLLISDNRDVCLTYMTLAGSGFTASVPLAQTAFCAPPDRRTVTTTSTQSSVTSTTTTGTSTGGSGSSGGGSGSSGGGSSGGSGSAGSGGIVSGAECTSQRTIIVRLRPSASDSNVAASVYIDGRLAAAVHQRGLTAISVSVRNKPPGRYAVEVVVTRASGKQVRTPSSYFVTCGRG